MNQNLQYCIDVQKMCEAKGRIHVLFVDTRGVITACNKLKADFFRDILGFENVIGEKIVSILDKLSFDTPRFIFEENDEILKQGTPRQFLQSWTIKLTYRLDLLTCKIPVYDPTGKPMGVLVISHILNKFSLETAYALGLTQRETQCLFHLLEGHTAKEIAKLLKISPRTVEGYIENMKNKLDCATTSELLLKAMQKEIQVSLRDISLSNGLSPFADSTQVRVDLL